MKHYQVHWIKPEDLRPCGECQACCTTMAVAELGKENFTRCKHQCSGGCSIYEQRPESCQTFECWYRGGLVKHRPDRIGVIANYNAVINTIYVWEVRPGARQNKKVKRLISSLTKTYPEARIYVVTKGNTPPLSVLESDEYKEYEKVAEELSSEIVAEIKELQKLQR